MIFISVDLPAPFSPSTAWISPGFTRRFTRSFAFTAGYCLLMSTSSSRSIVSPCVLGDALGRGASAGERTRVAHAVAHVARDAADPGRREVAIVGQQHPCEDPFVQAARHLGTALGDG